MSALVCSSRIDRVELYARGAVVTRVVTLPAALDAGPVDLAIEGVTALAELGSARATIVGDRDVVAVRGRVVLPEVRVVGGDATERVARLRQALEDRRAELELASSRRSALAALELDPGLARRAIVVNADARSADAFAIDDIVARELERLDDLETMIALEMEKTRRELNRAEHDARLADPSARHGAARPTVTFDVRLAGGGGALTALSLSYVVAAARWWPAYTARVANGANGPTVAIALDAFLAQDTGENWERVKLTVSTADLLTDARLPELPSLRLGRAQRSPARAYRPPPEGLDEMFGALDRARRQHRGVASAASAPLPRPAPPPPPSPAAYGARQGAAEGDAGASIGEVTRHTLSRSEPMELPKGAPVAGPLGGFGAPPPAAAPALAAPPMQAMKPRRRSIGLPRGGGGGGGEEEIEALLEQDLEPMEPPAPQAIEPTDAWLEFDALSLADPLATSGARGRLERGAPAAADLAESSRARIQALRAPHPLAEDPIAQRGRFDHAFDAEGLADVPSDAEPHRVAIASGSGAGTMRFVTVPREALEVYREVELENPLGAPILGGPIDVFVDDALLATTRTRPVDRGGKVHIGLGVEDRIKVARNVDVTESTAGLLGGATVVEHAIAVDLASALGAKATVDVLERVPVTDDKDLEIKLGKTWPDPEPYAQDDRGAHVRKGYRFRVDLPPGGKARVELGYRLQFSSKSEVQGGNRRD